MTREFEIHGEKIIGEEVRRGFGAIDLWKDLKRDEFVTASGLHDGGFIVWRK